MVVGIHAVYRTTQLAAVDLGSNSFRLEVGRAEGSHIYILDSLRSNVRLAAGLDSEKRLTPEACERGLEALRQFGQRLKGFHRGSVRAVATNTLRVARNAADFLQAAETALGFPIEVIAGREEARLIFSGVAHSAPPPHARQLVIDIGGGSTEFSVGTGFEPELMESLYMGSINHTMTHFPGGFIDDFTLKQAELAARREIQVIAADIRSMAWQSAVASSGTARSIARVLRENRVGNGEIDLDGMRWMRKAILCGGRIDNLNITGLKPDRALNLPGGFAILSAAFAELGISSLKISDNSLRLGVLYDLLGRLAKPSGATDKREETVAQFELRYRIDKLQASRVAALAMRFASDLAAGAGNASDDLTQSMVWAARLHEAGLTIAHNGYHKHSAYIVENADMPGFSRSEQKRLAFLILGHAGKLPKLTRMDPAPVADWMAVLCLRLAVLFNRSRQASPEPQARLLAKGRKIALHVDPEWLETQPLTEYSLSQEIEQWQALGEDRPFKVEFVKAPSAAVVPVGT